MLTAEAMPAAESLPAPKMLPVAALLPADALRETGAAEGSLWTDAYPLLSKEYLTDQNLL